MLFIAAFILMLAFRFMLPFLFIRDLDDVAAVEPVATLGGQLPAEALTKEEKKKQKKKQQKVQPLLFRSSLSHHLPSRM